MELKSNLTTRLPLDSMVQTPDLTITHENNRWVKVSEYIPWDELAKVFAVAYRRARVTRLKMLDW